MKFFPRTLSLPRLTGRQSMVIAVALLGGFFLVSFTFLNLQRSPVKIPTKSTAQSENPSISTDPAGQTATANSSAGPGVELTNFKRSENKNGKLAWELSGTAARYQLGGGEISITDANLATRLGSGELATLTAPEATVTLTGTSLNEARGKGGVKIVMESGMVLTAPSAKYDRLANTVSSTDQITIVHPQGSLTADSFTGDTAQQVFVFTGNVHTSILPSSKNDN